MKIGVGLDFGTSNSTVAWFDGTRLHFVRVERTGAILPTAVHLSRDYTGSTGTDAIVATAQSLVQLGLLKRG